MTTPEVAAWPLEPGLLSEGPRGTMYLSDSGAGLVEAFDFDGRTGAISGRRPLVHIDQSGKAPGVLADRLGRTWGCVRSVPRPDRSREARRVTDVRSEPP